MFSCIEFWYCWCVLFLCVYYCIHIGANRTNSPHFTFKKFFIFIFPKNLVNFVLSSPSFLWGEGLWVNDWIFYFQVWLFRVWGWPSLDDFYFSDFLKEDSPSLEPGYRETWYEFQLYGSKYCSPLFWTNNFFNLLSQI